MEGTLLEARAGKWTVARQLFKFLIQNVPWYGPIYLEAYRAEERNNRFNEAWYVTAKGLRELPRYGPLWFGNLRIMEHTDLLRGRNRIYRGHPPALTGFRSQLVRGLRAISRELIWKLHLECAQAEERMVEEAASHLQSISSRLPTLSAARDALLGESRRAMVRALLACPSNLRWKIWLVGARTEVSAGNMDRARKLLCRALSDCPVKSRSCALLECSRAEEHFGNVDCARRILLRTMQEYNGIGNFI